MSVDHRHHRHELEDGIAAEDIDLMFTPSLRNSVAHVEVDDETVLAEANTWRTHSVDRIGTVILAFFDGATPLEETSGELALAFGADPDVVRSDVLAFTRSLGSVGLLNGVRATPLPRAPVPNSLDVGARIPEFAHPTLDSGEISLGHLGGNRALLVNWHPGCTYCKAIAGELAALQGPLRESGTLLVLLSAGDVTANRELVESAGISAPVAVGDAPSPVFKGIGTPAAYLIDEQGRVLEPIAVGASEVPALAQRLAGLS